MNTFIYTTITSDAQYHQYCEKLEQLLESGSSTKAVQVEIEQLNLLIEKYDEKQNSFDDADPIELLKALMKDHKMKANELAELLNVPEGLVAEMLHYKKGLSKETIRTLSGHFKLREEVFDRKYSQKFL